MEERSYCSLATVLILLKLLEAHESPDATACAVFGRGSCAADEWVRRRCHRMCLGEGAALGNHDDKIDRARVAIVLYGQLPRPRRTVVDIARAIALVRDEVAPSITRRLVAPAHARGADVHLFGHSWANGQSPAEVRHSLLRALREGGLRVSTEVEVSNNGTEHLSDEILEAMDAGTFLSDGHPEPFVSIERGLGLLQNTGLDFEWVVVTRWDTVFYTDYRLDLLSPALFYLANVCSVDPDADGHSCHALAPLFDPQVEAEYAPDWVFAGSPSAVRAVFVDILSDFVQKTFGLPMSSTAFCRYFKSPKAGQVPGQLCHESVKLCHKNHGMVGLRVGSLQAQGIIAVGRYKYQLIDFDFIRELNYGELGIFDPRLLPCHTSERTRCVDRDGSSDNIWKLKRSVSSPWDTPSVCDLKTARGSGALLSPSCCPSSLAYCPCATSTAHLSRLMSPAPPDLASLCSALLQKVFTPSLSNETHLTLTLPCCAVASTFVDMWGQLHFVAPSVSPNATLSMVAETIARGGSESAGGASAGSRDSESRITQLLSGKIARRTWASADLAEYANGCFNSQSHTGIGREPAASTSLVLDWSLLQAGLSSAPDGLRVTAVLTTSIMNLKASASWVLHQG
jgi:hypothetical protein